MTVPPVAHTDGVGYRVGLGTLVPVLVWTLAAPSWIPWCRLLGGLVVILLVVLAFPA